MTAAGAPTLIVVGGGGGGLCTAITAAQHGATVHLLDKQEQLGGMLHIANGEFSGAGSRRQREHGIDDDPRRHFDDVLRISHGKVDRELAWMSVSAQGETVDWLDDLGFQFDPATPGLIHGHEVYSVPRTYWGVEHGRSVLRVLLEQLAPLLESGRIVLHLRTAVTGLLTDSAGRVTGVRVQGPADTAERQLTADAVVLATGGYDADAALRNQFLPAHCSSVLIGCLDHATGDGLVMARELGAAVSADGIFLPVMGLIPDPGRPGRRRLPRGVRGAGAGVPHAVRDLGNKRGGRFVAGGHRQSGAARRTLLEQPDVTMHVVFDQAAVDAAPVPLIRNPGGDWDSDRFAGPAATSPWVTRADTLPGLARKLGVDPAALESTVNDYNAAVAAGADPRLGRTVLPAPIGAGPFYAVTSVAASILSRDGLRVNTDLSVLRRVRRADPRAVRRRRGAGQQHASPATATSAA